LLKLTSQKNSVTLLEGISAPAQRTRCPSTASSENTARNTQSSSTNAARSASTTTPHFIGAEKKCSREQWTASAARARRRVRSRRLMKRKGKVRRHIVETTGDGRSGRRWRRLLRTTRTCEESRYDEVREGGCRQMADAKPLEGRAEAKEPDRVRRRNRADKDRFSYSKAELAEGEARKSGINPRPTTDTRTERLQGGGRTCWSARASTSTRSSRSSRNFLEVGDGHDHHHDHDHAHGHDHIMITAHSHGGLSITMTRRCNRWALRSSKPPPRTKFMSPHGCKPRCLRGAENPALPASSPSPVTTTAKCVPGPSH